MKKSEQATINAIVVNAMNEYNERNEHFYSTKILRSCSATVYETLHYYVLRSYSTVIAIIDKDTDTLYDFLRNVYGYTSTSAQHISKFEHDYCKGMYNCSKRYTFRYI